MPGLVQGYLAPAPAPAKLSSAKFLAQISLDQFSKTYPRTTEDLCKARSCPGLSGSGSRLGLLGYLAPPPPISCTLHTGSAKGGVCCNPRKKLRTTFS